MGNSPSSRRVTVVNDDVVGVVQVSESVVRRLKGDSEKSSDSSKSVSKESVPSSDPTAVASPSTFVPFSPIEPYSSTLEQRQKYHEEFKKAERSWQSRIRELESQNRQLLDAANENLSATLLEVETNHMKNSYAPVCPDKQQKVLQCYKENSKLPLSCSREVHDFMECVDKVRMTALTK